MGKLLQLDDAVWILWQGYKKVRPSDPLEPVFGDGVWEQESDNFRGWLIHVGYSEQDSERMIAALDQYRAIARAAPERLGKVEQPKNLEPEKGANAEQGIADLKGEAWRGDLSSTNETHPNIPAVDARAMALDEGGQGRSALDEYRPIRVNMAFHAGHLYYPTKALVRGRERTRGGVVRHFERTEIVVIRSDRTMQRVVQPETGSDSNSAQQVLRLTDNTIIEGRPTAPLSGTWSWQSIQAYLQGEHSLFDLRELVVRVHDHIRAKVWLPLDADYWLLSLSVAASYLQRVFDAVPLILLVGPHGSGKSELGETIAEVGANGHVISQASPATMIRAIDESGGLVVIDDLEAIAARGRAKHSFSEMAQVLKVGYKQATATKVITDGQGKPRSMHFFGIKVVSNTGGADEILGSRMLRVATKPLPEASRKEYSSRKGRMDSAELQQLRDSFHIWSFDNARKVYSTYLKLFSDRHRREDEIVAPLKVMAHMCGDPAIVEFLEEAITAQKYRSRQESSIEEAMYDICNDLAHQGYREISPTHISLLLRQHLNDSTDPRTSVEWVGRRLRLEGIVDERGGGRRRLFSSTLRVQPFADDFISKVGPINYSGETDPLAFCKNTRCESCNFFKHACPVAPGRRRRERR